MNTTHPSATHPSAPEALPAGLVEVVSRAAEFMDSWQILEFLNTPRGELRVMGVDLSPREWLLRGQDQLRVLDLLYRPLRTATPPAARG